jgi:DNA repair exonuclease SbcCD ATPase subunit
MSKIDLDISQKRLDKLVMDHDRRKNLHSYLQKTYKESEIDVAKKESDRIAVQDAAAFITTFINYTNKDMLNKISKLVQSSLQQVFGEPHTFRCASVVRRGQVELDMFVGKHGVERKINADGYSGGAADLIALILRVLVWTFTRKNRGMPIFIVDEPGRNVDIDNQKKLASLIQSLSKKLNIQFIFVTHCFDVTKISDASFRVTQSKLVSKVEDIK